MQHIQEIIDNPPVTPLFSEAVLRGQELVITVEVTRVFPWKVVAGLGIVGALLVVVGLSSGQWGACCLGLPILLGGIPLVIFGTRKFVGIGARRLRLSPGGLELSSAKTLAGLDGAMPTSIPLSAITGYELEERNKDYVVEAKKGEVSGPPSFRRPGIYFYDTRGQEQHFDTSGLISGGKLIGAASLRGYAEAQWLFNIVDATMNKLTAGAQSTPQQSDQRPVLEAPPAPIADPQRIDDLGAADDRAPADAPGPMDDTESW